MVAEPRPDRPGLPNTSLDLDRVVIVAATYREMDTEARETLAAALRPANALFSEQMVLHTCHRVEKMGVLADGRTPFVPPGTRWYRGSAAIEHVFLVAGGFDSAIVGEEQILGQVRDAFRGTQDDGSSGPLLGELMRRAIRFGRQVRSQAHPVAERSLADRAAAWLVARLASHPGATGLVIGTGEMGRQLALHLANANISVTVASRHVSRAQRLSGRLPQPNRHRAAELTELLARPLAFDAVAVALRGGTTSITEAHLLARQPSFVVDLSAPRSLTDSAAAMLGERLLDLDSLGSGPASTTMSPATEARLRDEARRETQRFVAWLELRSSGDGIALLRRHAEEVRRKHLARLGERADLSGPQAVAVDAMTEALVGELLHVPTVQLRRDPEAARRVREVFGID